MFLIYVQLIPQPYDSTFAIIRQSISSSPHTLASQKGPAAFAGPFRLWEIMKYQSIFTMLPQPAAQRFLLRFFLRGAERAGFWVGTESLECFCSIRYLT